MQYDLFRMSYLILSCFPREKGCPPAPFPIHSLYPYVWVLHARQQPTNEMKGVHALKIAGHPQRKGFQAPPLCPVQKISIQTSAFCPH